MRLCWHKRCMFIDYSVKCNGRISFQGNKQWGESTFKTKIVVSLERRKQPGVSLSLIFHSIMICRLFTSFCYSRIVGLHVIWFGWIFLVWILCLLILLLRICFFVGSSNASCADFQNCSLWLSKRMVCFLLLSALMMIYSGLCLCYQKKNMNWKWTVH